MPILKIGHRGASGHAPENTLASMRKAIELGANAVELDVHLCKTGEPVVIHDATLERTTNGKGDVAAHTLTQLRGLNAGDGERIPTLEEILSEFAEHATIFIEIKDQKSAEPVAALVQRFAKKFSYDRLPIIGFDSNLLLALKEKYPELCVGLTPPNRIPENFAKRAADAGVWSVNPCIDTLKAAFVTEAHDRGLKIITWTANTPRKIAKAKTLGVDGIISDFPERL